MNRRKGSRFGHDKIVDGMLKDGLWDVYNDCSMGMCAELCSDNHSILREEQVIPPNAHMVYAYVDPLILWVVALYQLLRLGYILEWLLMHSCIYYACEFLA